MQTLSFHFLTIWTTILAAKTAKVVWKFNSSKWMYIFISCCRYTNRTEQNRVEKRNSTHRNEICKITVITLNTHAMHCVCAKRRLINFLWNYGVNFSNPQHNKTKNNNNRNKNFSQKKNAHVKISENSIQTKHVYETFYLGKNLPICKIEM